MNTTFDLIGLKLPGEQALGVLAEQADSAGEATRLLRSGRCVLHGRCWKLGQGLEVWTVLYESNGGEVFYADCRPGFRARYTQRISPWALTEYDEEGEAIVHGYCDDGDTEVLFELQNLTEVGIESFRSSELHVGLCGLAYEARVCGEDETTLWQPANENSVAARKGVLHENDWSLRGRIINFKSLNNPLSGTELCWVHLDLEKFKLEVLINRGSLRSSDNRKGKRASHLVQSNAHSELRIGAMLAADIWLQGHVLDRRALLRRYEGVDRAVTPAGMWKHLKRSN